MPAGSSFKVACDGGHVTITKTVSFDFDLCDLLASATPEEIVACYAGREAELIVAAQQRMGAQQ